MRCIHEAYRNKVLLHRMRHRETSVGEDVYEHVGRLGLLSKQGIGRLQLRMPCQAAALQQRHCLLVNDLYHLQQCNPLSWAAALSTLARTLARTGAAGAPSPNKQLESLPSAAVMRNVFQCNLSVSEPRCNDHGQADALAVQFAGKRRDVTCNPCEDPIAVLIEASRPSP